MLGGRIRVRPTLTATPRMAPWPSPRPLVYDDTLRQRIVTNLAASRAAGDRPRRAAPRRSRRGASSTRPRARQRRPAPRTEHGRFDGQDPGRRSRHGRSDERLVSGGASLPVVPSRRGAQPARLAMGTAGRSVSRWRVRHPLPRSASFDEELGVRLEPDSRARDARRLPDPLRLRDHTGRAVGRRSSRATARSAGRCWRRTESASTTCAATTSRRPVDISRGGRRARSMYRLPSGAVWSARPDGGRACAVPVARARRAAAIPSPASSNRCLPGAPLTRTFKARRGGQRSAAAVAESAGRDPSPSSASTICHSTSSTRCTTSWAMRSPRCTSYGLARISVEGDDFDLATIGRVDQPR